jgi:hypothetical protein
MTTEAKMTDDQMMAKAREVAGDDCALTWYGGDYKHRAIRITGCSPEEARRIGMAIQTALFGPADPETGLLPIDPRHRGFGSQADWAAVWVR